MLSCRFGCVLSCCFLFCKNVVSPVQCNFHAEAPHATRWLVASWWRKTGTWAVFFKVQGGAGVEEMKSVEVKLGHDRKRKRHFFWELQYLFCFCLLDDAVDKCEVVVKPLGTCEDAASWNLKSQGRSYHREFLAMSFPGIPSPWEFLRKHTLSKLNENEVTTVDVFWCLGWTFRIQAFKQFQMFQVHSWLCFGWSLWPTASNWKSRTNHGGPRSTSWPIRGMNIYIYVYIYTVSISTLQQSLVQKPG